MIGKYSFKIFFFDTIHESMRLFIFWMCDSLEQYIMHKDLNDILRRMTCNQIGDIQQE